MATFVKESIVEAGLIATYNAAAAGGDTFVNEGLNRVFLHAKNANGALTRTVTVAADQSTTEKEGFGPLTKADIVIVIAALGDEFFGPFPRQAFGANPVITYSDAGADITLALLEV